VQRTAMKKPRVSIRSSSATAAREPEGSERRSTPTGARSNSNAIGDSAESLVSNTTRDPLHDEPSRLPKEDEDEQGALG